MQKIPAYDILGEKTTLWFSINYKFGAIRYSSCSRTVFIKRFYFYLLKADHYWDINAFLNKQKPKEKFSDNLEQNICRLFYFLTQFVFTTNETDLYYYYQKLNVRVASGVAEQLKTEELLKLNNFKKITGKHAFDCE